MRRVLVAIAFAAATLGVALPPAGAQVPAPPVIDSVQEDWQLVVASTDRAGVGPQITTCMSTVADDSDPFVAFDLNFREYPSFRPGGLQVQVWSGDNVLATSSQGTSTSRLGSQISTRMCVPERSAALARERSFLAE